MIAIAVGLPLARGSATSARAGSPRSTSPTSAGRSRCTPRCCSWRSARSARSYFGPYGRAGLATLIALVLFALPPIITNTYVGMREVDRDLVEAARGMGMNGWQLFRSVELPLALPVILTGVRLALVQVWATATIAALVAGPGLGFIITRGFLNHRTEEVVAGAILVAVGALLFEGLAVLASGTSTRCGRPGRPRALRKLSAGNVTLDAVVDTEWRRSGCCRPATWTDCFSPLRVFYVDADTGALPGAHRTRAGTGRGTQKVVHLMKLKQKFALVGSAAVLLATWRRAARTATPSRSPTAPAAPVDATRARWCSVARTSPRCRSWPRCTSRC